MSILDGSKFSGLDFFRIIPICLRLVRLGSLGMVVGWLARKGSGVVFLQISKYSHTRLFSSRDFILKLVFIPELNSILEL